MLLGGDDALSTSNRFDGQLCELRPDFQLGSNGYVAKLGAANRQFKLACLKSETLRGLQVVGRNGLASRDDHCAQQSLITVWLERQARQTVFFQKGMTLCDVVFPEVHYEVALVTTFIEPLQDQGPWAVTIGGRAQAGSVMDTQASDHVAVGENAALILFHNFTCLSVDGKVHYYNYITYSLQYQ